MSETQRTLANGHPPDDLATTAGAGDSRPSAPEISPEQARRLAELSMGHARTCRRVAYDALAKADFYLEEAERWFDLAYKKAGR